MTTYNYNNFAYSTVATAPSPASSGTSLVVDDPSSFPTPPFIAVVWPEGFQPLASNAEVIYVTGVAGSTFTIVRAREGSPARTILVGDQIAANITSGLLDQISNQTGASFNGARVEVTSFPVVGDGSGVNIEWGSAAYDTDAYWSPSAPTTLVPATSGIYLVGSSAFLDFDGASDVENYYVSLRQWVDAEMDFAELATLKDPPAQTGTAYQYVSATLVTEVEVAVGDYFIVQASQLQTSPNDGFFSGSFWIDRRGSV